MRRLSIAPIACAMIAIPVAGRATPAAEIVRTVYVSAHDVSGAQVTDLTVADLAVKEGGKNRVIKDVKRASEPLQVSLLVFDGGTGGFQTAAARFIDALLPRAEFAIRVFNPQPSRIADFTNDIETLKAAINRIGPRGRVPPARDQIVEAVSDAAKELRHRKASRPVIIVMTLEAEQADGADAALNELTASGASLSVIGPRTGPVLGDGPTRSGGVTDDFLGVISVRLLAKIVDNLLHQYVVTYTLPDGVKPNGRFALTTNRTGVTLIAPTHVPDK